MRADGFAALTADYEGGMIYTKPFIFSGERLVVNYASSAAGEVRFEIQDKAGLPVPGYRLDQCLPIFGDEIERVVRWVDGSDVSRKQGEVVRLRVFLKDADLFAIKFSEKGELE